MSAEFILVRSEDRHGIPNAAGGDIYVDLATGDGTNEGYYLVHAIVPLGGGPLAHIHTREEEAFYVIRGDLVFTVDGEPVEVTAGASSTFRGVPNTSSTTPRTPKRR